MGRKREIEEDVRIIRNVVTRIYVQQTHIAFLGICIGSKVKQSKGTWKHIITAC
jgi:hypothetical protein